MAILFMIMLPIMFLGLVAIGAVVGKFMYLVISVIIGDESVIQEFDCSDKKRSFWGDIWDDLSGNYYRPPPPEYLKWKEDRDEEELKVLREIFIFPEDREKD
jgi:hypothetical protein